MICKFKVNGLDCANCANELEEAIQKLKEVKNVRINFMTQKMELEFDGDKEEILKQVKKIIKKEEPDVIIEEV